MSNLVVQTHLASGFANGAFSTNYASVEVYTVLAEVVVVVAQFVEQSLPTAKILNVNPVIVISHSLSIALKRQKVKNCKISVTRSGEMSTLAYILGYWANFNCNEWSNNKLDI